MLTVKNLAAGYGQSQVLFDVSFGIGPRLNAAGRMVHGEVVVELLTTKDSIRAEKLAKQLNDLNLERQEVEGTVKTDAIRIVEEAGGPGAGIVVWDPEFHTGVIGIVAGLVLALTVALKILKILALGCVAVLAVVLWQAWERGYITASRAGPPIVQSSPRWA